MNKTKVCTKCLERKVLDEFTRHPLLREGRMNHCKKCRAKAYREKYAAAKLKMEGKVEAEETALFPG